MTNDCCVNGCSHSSKRTNVVSYHRIPTVITNKGSQIRELTAKRRRLWIKQINRKEVTDKTVRTWTRVCSTHFIKGKPSELHQEDNPDWIPTLHLGYTVKPSSFNRYDRRQNRKQNHGQGTFPEGLNEAELAETDGDGHAETMDSESDTQTATMDSDTQTDITMDYMQAMEADIQKLRTEKIMLQQKVDRQSVTFSEKFFEREDGSSDDDKVRYYTGLPSLLTLVGVVSFLSPSITSGPRTITSKLQEILIVLFRLRLNLPIQVVADMFKISPTAVSRIFLKVLHVMYIKMKPLISWPDREDLRRNMPFEFRKYFGNKVTVIIDCFELFIEIPSLLKARAQTWSNYKHHNTVKYLIGITPQGVVSFISAGWGGRASDKWITENSTFLDRLLPGDLVLADRGFNIQESVGLMCAEVKIPAFTKGKKQLSAFEVESTRKIAHVRIHVERVIGNIVQKYPILGSTMPITMLNIGENEDATTLDKIVTVCCALVNMCPSVVPFD